MNKIIFEFITAFNGGDNIFMEKAQEIMDSDLGKEEAPYTETMYSDRVEKVKYIQDFTTCPDRYSIRYKAAHNLNNTFFDVVRLMMDHKSVMSAENDTYRNTISFEIWVPDNAGTLKYVAREVLHEQFKGCKDYIDSNVVVFSEGHTDPDDVNSFTECGVNIDFTKCSDPATMLSNVAEAFGKITSLSEYLGILENRCSTTVFHELVELRKTMKQKLLSLKCGDKEDCLKEYYNVICEMKKILNKHYGATNKEEF